MSVSRRFFLRSTGAALVAATTTPLLYSQEKRPGFQTRGVVLVPEDFTLPDWPERAHRAGLTTIGVHSSSVPHVVRFIESDGGKKFLRDCERLHLDVEYELHAMADLLPRTLFASKPSLFRVNEAGERTPDSNLCVHSSEALGMVVENALKFSNQLKPSTNRFFFWFDDAKPGCRCSKCIELSDSDQALLVENKIAEALRARSANAMVAHLAYDKTIRPPQELKPAPGVFLEFAPIHRAYDKPFAEQTGRDQTDSLQMLEANLRVFPAETAQILEYWIDVSRFSKWKRPAIKCPWRADVMAADLKTYAALGIRHVTSFGVFIDAEYLRLHGEPDFLNEYGALLRKVV